MIEVNVNPVLEWIVWRVSKNKNAIIIVNGPTGSGKTYTALRLAQDTAERLGSNFNIKDNVDFNFAGLLKKTMLKQNSKPGTCFVFEEVGSTGSGSSAREWQSKANKFFFSFMQTTRHRQQVLFLTCPNFSFLEAGTRSLVHMQISMARIDFHKQLAYAKPYILQHNARTGKIYFKLLRFTHDEIKHKLSLLKVKKASPEILEDYEKMKMKFTTDLNKMIIEEEEKAQKPKSEFRKPRKLTKEIALELHEGGVMNSVIARRYDVSRAYVTKLLKVKA